VQQRHSKNHRILHPALEPEHMSQIERMVDIGQMSSALASLIPMLPGRKTRGAKNKPEVDLIDNISTISGHARQTACVQGVKAARISRTKFARSRGSRPVISLNVDVVSTT